MAIFQKSVINKHLNNLDKEQIEKAYLKFRRNYNPSKIEQIKTLKEEEYQDGFLRDIFVDVFGYTLRPDENYNLQREFKNQTDGKKADGAIIDNRGINPLALAVIELKSTKTKDLTKVTQQAFNYKNNQPECNYVITSNFQKLRFYIDYANEYEEFDLFHLEKEDFELLYLLLNKESIFANLPLKLKEETKFHEQEVSGKLYNDYSCFKRNLYENLIKNNPERDKLTLFKKSQKLLDRFLFILFAEDSGLLPPNSISRVIDNYHKLIELDAKKPLYDIFKQYFGYMNIGRKGKTSAGDIPAYNGGLFYTDDLLDNLKIDDKILIDDLLNLSEYDFNTEIDVNILGHIFEHSLNEIEEITAEIERTTVSTRDLSPLRISKRKKDGVFYTPKYITQYIVENTVGTLCNEKRIALDIEEIEFDRAYRTKAGKLSEKGKKLFQKLKEYKEWLIALKILDPACGSGAFLNQSLNFLIKEHTIIDDIIAELTNAPMRLFDVDKSILENNLFGVDINEESVEIAKLSLWLRTAQKGRKLSKLNNNIKCGNSLIDDPKIAGDKAFHWQTEFPQVFKEKDKKLYHITTAIHDSRTSVRMEKYKVREKREMGTNPYPKVIYFTKEDDLLITQTIAKIVSEDKLNLLAYNICADHIHLLLACDIDEVASIMQKIKGKTSFIYKGLYKGLYKGFKPLAKEEERKKDKPLWQQKYSAPKEITTEEQLQNTLRYIQKNRSKHELPEHSDEIKQIIDTMCVDFETAMKPEYIGGFDCVIGNPPYLNMTKNNTNNKWLKYYKIKYKSVAKANSKNLFTLFNELAVNIVKNNSLVSFIIPEGFLKTRSYNDCVNEMNSQGKIFKAVYFDDWVFEDATTGSLIFEFIKNPKTSLALENYLMTKQRQVVKIEHKENSILTKYESLDFPFISDFCDLFKGMAVKNRSEFIHIEQSNYPNIFLLGNCIDRYVFTNQFFCDYKALTIVGGTKKIEKHSISPRILIRRTGNYLCCVMLKEPALTESTLYSCSIKENLISLDFLLALLNSKILTYIVRQKMITNEQAFPQIMMTDIKLLKIPIANNKIQQKLGEYSISISNISQQLQEKSNKFLSRVEGNFIRGLNPLHKKENTTLQNNTIKITKKLSAFYNFDFKTFVAELKKQKVTISLKQQDEWQDYFDSYKLEINGLQHKIQQTDTKIDQMVYELYGLNDEEIAIVEKSFCK